MRKKSTLFIALGLSIILFVLNYIALAHSLYWSVAWYDIMMHFLGGLTLGVPAIWFLGIQNRSLKSFLTFFISVMSACIGYEFFEYLNDMNYLVPQNYAIDTTYDVMMDALGAISAYLATTSRSR